MSQSRTAAMLLLLCAALGRSARAEPESANAPLPSDPVFSALLTDGSSVSGRIRQFGPKGEVTLVPLEGPDRTIPTETLVKLTREGSLPALTPLGSLVLLPDGDRLYRTLIVSTTETALEVNPERSFESAERAGNLSLPLESIVGLVLNPPTDSDALVALTDRIRSEPRTEEVVWLANGDRLSGRFVSFDEKRIEFKVGGKPVELDRAGTVALGFDPALVTYPRPENGFLELTSVDGSRLGVTNPRIEQGQVVATARFGGSIRLALNELAKVHARTSAVEYLSEREADGAKYVSYVGPTRPYRKNAAVDGHPLRVGGQTFDRGLGCQSRTLLAYKLAPGARRFQALVGLDDSAGPLGSVVFRVLVDGVERFASPPMSARDTPKAIDLDLAGAKVLILVTEFGERGEVRDFADWVEARIIR